MAGGPIEVVVSPVDGQQSFDGEPFRSFTNVARTAQVLIR